MLGNWAHIYNFWHVLSEIKGLSFLFSLGVLLCIKNDDIVFARDKAKMILVKKQKHLRKVRGII